MASGVVKKFDREKGFGFIVSAGSDTDVYLHMAKRQRSDRPKRYPVKGDLIVFTLKKREKGFYAGHWEFAEFLSPEALSETRGRMAPESKTTTRELAPVYAPQYGRAR